MDSDKWQQIKDVFNATLAVAERDRAAYLLSRCGGDAVLLDELRSLFKAHDEYDGFIDSPACRSINSFVSETKVPSRIGRIVGTYRIESEIGRGGMGTVYLATRADREFDKKVAIKLINRGLDTDEIIKRFCYERQILAALEHPYITRLLDGGSTKDGLPFLVMDYVDGALLNVYCDREELSIRERLELFLQICSAVSYAHQNLVIHRDLKPSNVIVRSDGTPKLLDFGIARLTAASAGVSPSFASVQRERVMTPEYASPEQINGDPVTTSTDVYSLGVILYELLTGHKPYRFQIQTLPEINRVLSSTRLQKPSSICKALGPRIVARERNTIVRQLTGDLDKIVFMAMRMEPERRYSSVEQFANDIRGYLEGRPVIAREDSVAYRASKFAGRNKSTVATGVGIAVSLIGGLIVARRQAKVAERQRDGADRANQFVQNMLAAPDPRRSGKDLRVVEMLQVAGETIETEFGTQPGIAADLNATIGLTYLSLGQIETAGKHLRSALDLRIENFPRESVAVARGLRDYAKFLHAKGDLTKAEPYYRGALAIFRRHRRRGRDVADVLSSLENLSALMGDNDGGTFSCRSGEDSNGASKKKR